MDASEVEMVMTDDLGWECPFCGSPFPPREEPKGTYCVSCWGKIETCCEGAALPERTDP